MTHRTKGQQRALRELCALARTALEVCDMIAERSEKNDDRPRLYLVTFERWTRGEETGAQLAARTRALNSWGASLTKGDTRGETARLILNSALAWLVDAREDLMKNPGHNWHVGRVASHLASTLDALTGNGMEAETHRVKLILAKHTADVVRAWATTMRTVSDARAQIDKMAADQAIGTLPGMK